MLRCILSREYPAPQPVIWGGPASPAYYARNRYRLAIYKGRLPCNCYSAIY
jgi:hypothetical protein